MQHLFLLSIGPVQEFIAAARRTRDLWAGSMLLSSLARRAALALRQEHQATLIFPAQDDLNTHDVVNRIVARLADGADPHEVGTQVEERVRAELKQWMSTVFDNRQRITWPDDPSYRQRAEAQMADLIEIVWVAVPLLDDVPQTRRHLDAAMMARKYTRTFHQPSWALEVPKSSIDGRRESVIDDREFDADYDPAPFANKTERLLALYGAGPAERLSGVDLFKRHYRARDEQADFPSTSHFAALPMLWRAHTAGLDVRQGLDAYLQALRAAYALQAGNRRLNMLKLDPRFSSPVTLNDYDASILFASRLAEELDGQALSNAQAALATYLHASVDDQPEPYYAILMADGDSMGEVIDRQPDLEQQRQLGLALDAFAAGVRGIVEDPDLYRGALVYAGGDDLLAFVPLDSVIDCATALHASYAEKMQAFGATLSVGIAICHHLEPLTDALRLVHEAEDLAKARMGKNGLAIILSKRAGVDTTISGGWDSPFVTRLQLLIDRFQQDAIPDGVAYELRSLDERVGATLPPTALVAEAGRILQRKRGARGTQRIASDDLALLTTALAAESGNLKDGRPVRGIDQLADELIVAREIARARGTLLAEKGAPV
ncbi:type III-B CRISPR-associated protein Cas10/Cmr2 [Candidatus Oscillochloris fontis]|uniref:type III-B CRISPR-associated protein Cas10/Cmr2 n=1 Tax=Candidatus Oscillochloris fontis TaxID=2496868 RepID=UPI00101D3962|nr:type III-B CRISPR-associated protein Cas10/Cmr2 [Candidatus Oscillochloris fontis]